MVPWEQRLGTLVLIWNFLNVPREEEFHTHIHGVWYYWLRGTRSALWRDGAQERCVFIWCSKAVTSICSQFKCYNYFICTIHRWSWRFIANSVLMTKAERYLCWYYYLHVPVYVLQSAAASVMYMYVLCFSATVRVIWGCISWPSSVHKPLWF